MLSTPHVSSHAVRPQGVTTPGTSQMPETEGFDFMTYLLGLKAEPQVESMDTQGPLAFLNGKAPAEGAEDPILSLFNKNKVGGWNPMFPNPAIGTVTPQGG